ncbi:hypothetical protein [Streptantibioticus silvisoli]|uniref:DUF3168 domain-containing protein n=1 Tax=Streptantibioticus silvisoli TaxID=2705255 RepID=A0ABT6W8B1_9ACTN|nr:hypothetical protein [Streptantibioticus silvisoli]MDI5965721.1 hypothetical protein [Streptantibioticus silvisoli]
MSTADAVAREAAWLAAYDPTDGLPALLRTSGGPFDVVQAYLPRTPPARRACLFVLRSGIHVERFGFNRKINHHTFSLRITWPQSSGTGQAESVQSDLDEAVDLILQRVNGLFGDKTHGARFLSVAENPMDIDVQFDDPDITLQPRADLTARITYQGDDQDYTS